MLFRIINIILLMVIFGYGQAKIKYRDLAPETQKTISDLAADSAASVIQDSIAFPVDTTALKLLNMDEGRVAYLKQLSSTNPYGGGEFVIMDSTYSEAYGGVTFPHLTPGLQFVRRQYHDDPGFVNVFWFGAIPDTTDVTAAFIKANRMGTTIYAPPIGAYRISSGMADGKFSLWGSRRLIGGGKRRTLTRDVTIFYPAADGDTVLSFSSQNAVYGNGVSSHMAEMHDFIIEGVYGTDSAKVGIFSDDCDNLIENVNVIRVTRADTSIGIVLTVGNSSMFINSETYLCDIGAHLANTKMMCFDRCRFLYSKIIGVKLFETELTSFLNCSFEAQWPEPPIPRPNKVPHEDVIHDHMNLTWAVRTLITNPYVEQVGDTTAVWMRIDTTTRENPSYYASEIDIFSPNIKVASLNAAIDVESGGRVLMNIIGGAILVKEGYPPINAENSINHSINLINMQTGTPSMPVGGLPVYILDYDSAKYFRNTSWQTSPDFELYGWMEIYDGVDSGIHGVRSSGIGSASRGLWNGIDLHHQVWDGFTSLGYLVITNEDTFDLDIDFFTTPGVWAGKDYSGRLVIKHGGGEYGDVVDFEYFHGDDGSITNDFSYTIKAHHPTANMQLDTMYIEIGSSTTSLAKIVIVPDSAISGAYISGKTILGSGVEKATLTERNP